VAILLRLPGRTSAGIPPDFFYYVVPIFYCQNFLPMTFGLVLLAIYLQIVYIKIPDVN
jgi:hypothetical protein